MADCPQNIILIIIDGGGFNHIDAMDYYACGKKGQQPFEKFPVKLAMTTCSIGGSYEPQKAAKNFNYVKTGFTDSAAASAAMSTGTKTFKGAIGVDANGNNLEHIIERCEKLGMSTGIVTTVQISHATPAGFAAHDKSRKDFHQIADGDRIADKWTLIQDKQDFVKLADMAKVIFALLEQKVSQNQ